MQTTITSSNNKLHAHLAVVLFSSLILMGLFAFLPNSTSAKDSLNVDYTIESNLALTLNSNTVVVSNSNPSPTTTATVTGNSIYNLVVVNANSDSALTNGTGGRIEAAPLTGVSTLAVGTWGIKTAITAGAGTNSLDSNKYYGVPIRTSATNSETGELEDTSTPLVLMARESLDSVITGDIATITYGINTSDNQPAGTYQDNIIYTVSPIVVPEVYDYTITSVSPYAIAANTSADITINTNIPNKAELTISSISLKPNGGSTTSTCTNPQADNSSEYVKLNCTAPALAEGSYDVSANVVIGTTDLTMGKTNALVSSSNINPIQWMYPTTMLTSGTKDKLVIATGNSDIATTDSVTVRVDGQICASPKVVNGGTTDGTNTTYFKFITCTPPAMSSGTYYVTANITHDSTAYTFNGKAVTYKEASIVNRLTNIPGRTMQNINQLDTSAGSPDTAKTFCANSTTPKFGDAIELIPEVKLTDARDGQEYTVRKLADGNCWMTENLRYGSTASDGARPYQSSDEALSDNLNNAKMSELTTSRICTTNTNCKTADNLRGFSPDTGTDNYTMPYIMTYQANTANVDDADLNTTKYGVLYNYCAATGGTVCTNVAMTADAPGSICPANWQLPAMTANPTSTDSTATAIKDGSVKTYDNLLNNYNINYRGNVFDSEETKLMTNSLDFVRAGYADNGTLYHRRAAGCGYYWASTRYSSANYAYSLGFYSNYTYRNGSSLRYIGRSVRCVAR